MSAQDNFINVSAEENVALDSSSEDSPTIRSRFGVKRALVAGITCITGIICGYHLSGAAVALLSSRSGNSTPFHVKPAVLRKLEDPACSGERLIVFDHSYVPVNNLGDHGPLSGEASIIFTNVLPGSGRSVNLRVHVDTPADSGWTHTYCPEHSFLNGLSLPFGDRTGSRSRYGQINLKPGTEVNLRFEFINGVTGQPERVESFYFSFFHMTSESGGTSRMQVTTEGFGIYHLSDDTKLRMSTVGYGEIEIQPKDSPFMGNPTDSSASDMDRAVTFQIPTASEFALTLAVTHGSLPQSFQFSGPSALVCEETHLY